MIKFKYEIIDPIEDSLNDNVDVYVTLDDSRTFYATFYTIQNIIKLMEIYRKDGQYLNGLYVTDQEMIIIRELTPSNIEATIHHLLAEGGFFDIFGGPTK